MSKKTEIFFQRFQRIVGETGFEPATLRSQSECATGLRHSPRFSKTSKIRFIAVGRQYRFKKKKENFTHSWSIAST